MMFLKVASGLFLLILTVSLNDAVLWNDFRVTYRLTLINGFTRMPRLEQEARSQGWEKLPGNFTCHNDGQYNGLRYRIPGDNSVILIFDVNGVIAGMQMWTPQSDVLTNSNNTFRFGSVPHFNNATLDGQHYFVLTSYFIHPSLICNIYNGRNESTLISEGTGTGLFIQSGPTPYSLLEVPHKREDALKVGWSNNKCFPAMGTHSWYKMEDYERKDCDEQVPVFGLWNKKMELHGFGFTVMGVTDNKRFEKPLVLSTKVISGPIAPKCILDKTESIGKTSIHVYFVDRPWLISCPLNNIG